MMTLIEMPKFGDKVRYLGGMTDLCIKDITEGKTYKIEGVEGNDTAYYLDDKGEKWFIPVGCFEYYELITEPDEVDTVKGSPELIDLLANLSRRLHEVEQTINPKGQADAPNDQTQAERIEAVCNEVRDLLIRKNHDYGDSFSKQFAKYGVNSAMIRMDDKMRRLETLLSGEQAQVAESIEDSIADLAGYALLALVELRKSTLN